MNSVVDFRRFGGVGSTSPMARAAQLGVWIGRALRRVTESEALRRRDISSCGGGGVEALGGWASGKE